MTPRRDVRRASNADWPAIVEIFWRGVHEGAADRYDEDQRRAWLPHRPEPDGFRDRCDGQAVWVSEEAGQVTGFMTLRGDGYLDFAYVLPGKRGTGTADALLAVLENHAMATGLPGLTTRASAFARPFFARHGWTVTAPAPQTRDGVTIPATDMARSF